MPWIVPFIPLIAAGATAGTSLYEAQDASANQASAQKQQQDALLKQQQTAANQANLTKQEAVLGAQGQTQQQTGGSLTDPGTAALTDLLAGYPGYQNGGTSGTGGGTGTGNGTSTDAGVGASGVPGNSGSGTPDIASILAALRNGGSGLGGGVGLGGPGGTNLSGGNWQTQPSQPSTYFELANPPL